MRQGLQLAELFGGSYRSLRRWSLGRWSLAGGRTPGGGGTLEVIVVPTSCSLSASCMWEKCEQLPALAIMVDLIPPEPNKPFSPLSCSDQGVL